jgi:hypothetical protein
MARPMNSIVSSGVELVPASRSPVANTITMPAAHGTAMPPTTAAATMPLRSIRSVRSSQPSRKTKTTRPSCAALSSPSITVGGNRNKPPSGHIAPSRDGPSSNPPTISPSTGGWWNRRASEASTWQVTRITATAMRKLVTESTACDSVAAHRGTVPPSTTSPVTIPIAVRERRGTEIIAALPTASPTPVVPTGPRLRRPCRRKRP